MQERLTDDRSRDGPALPIVRLVTALGELLIEVDQNRAPKSSAAFLAQIDSGEFSGGAFWRTVHRSTDRGSPAIEVIQASVSSQTGLTVPLEPTSMTGLRHVHGTVSLPRASGLPSSLDGFFVCIGDQPGLDAGSERIEDLEGFAAFARVIEGMDVATTIFRQPTRPDAPFEYVADQVLAKCVAIEMAARVTRPAVAATRPDRGDNR